MSKFSQVVDAMYHYMARIISFIGNYASNMPSEQYWTKITPQIEFFSVITSEQFAA